MSETLEDLKVLITARAGSADVCIHVRGELDVATTDVLRTALGGALEAGLGNVDLELSAMTFCDSTGLCLLISAQRELTAAGRTLRLLNPAPGTLRLLELSGTCHVFDIRTSPSAQG